MTNLQQIKQAAFTDELQKIAADGGYSYTVAGSGKQGHTGSQQVGIGGLMKSPAAPVAAAPARSQAAGAALASKATPSAIKG